MIYLVITTSLNNTFWSDHPERREQEYRTAMTESLSHLPAEIQPIIVENNGKRATFLDHFLHKGKSVPVIYTDNNAVKESKGVKELLDLQAVIRQKEIQPMDIVIKLTGRYRVTSSSFFENVMKEEDGYDSFLKFHDVVKNKPDSDQAVLGFYAIRSMYLSYWSPKSIDIYPSAEVAFARYNRRSVPRLKELSSLGLTCVFSDDGRSLPI
jgi:hypothetical protein